MQAKFIGILIVTGLLVCRTTAEEPRNVKVNEAAVRFAQELISEGRFIADKHGEWLSHRPSTAQGNDFIRKRGWTDYARWHLGVDQSHVDPTKVRYKFPFGDYTHVRRSALIAIKNRAQQFGYPDIAKAAADLLQRLEEKARVQR